jgi:very-short-patch-repair endonuclease
MPRATRGQTTAKTVLTARELRRQPTPTEEKLWKVLRGRHFGGLKFRRQHPYGPFILDSFCVERQLAIELDGGIHDDPEQAAYDTARTEYLAERGLQVLRFRNEEIAHDLPGVLRRIWAAVAASPPDPPLLNCKRRSSGEGELEG